MVLIIQYPKIIAIAPQGLFGAFTGRLGNMSGYIRNGKNILRTSTSSVKYKPTAQRTAQLHKLSLCNRFTKAFTGTGFFNKSFPANSNTNSGYNRVTSALLSQAITGTYPGMRLEYAQVLISKGKLPPAENAAASVDNNGNIRFTFKKNTTTGIAAADDKVILVAYAEALQQAIFSLNAGSRKDGQAMLETKLFKGYQVQTWIGFLSHNEIHASDSAWTGRFDV